LIFLCVLFTSCHNKNDTLCFSKAFNLSVLPLWDVKTKINVAFHNNKRLVSLFNSASKDNISLFDREQFLKEVSNLAQTNSYKYKSLIVVEFNSSGERYVRTKYLIMFQNQKAQVLIFQRNQGRWEFIKAHTKETHDVSEAISSIMDRSDGEIYWGSSINDLVAISKFEEDNKILVEVFGSLSKKQYNALSIIAN
jgi:hypothetical protein